MERTLDEIAADALHMRDDVERLWVLEAARRYQQLLDGTAISIPSEEVFARLKARRATR